MVGGSGGGCKVIFVENLTVVLRLGWGFDNLGEGSCNYCCYCYCCYPKQKQSQLLVLGLRLGVRQNSVFILNCITMSKPFMTGGAQLTPSFQIKLFEIVYAF